MLGLEMCYILQAEKTLIKTLQAFQAVLSGTSQNSFLPFLEQFIQAFVLSLVDLDCLIPALFPDQVI